MPRSNIKLLSKEERLYFKENYEFKLTDGYILIKFKGFGKVTAKDIYHSFSLSAKVRKITIHPEAIQVWANNFSETDYSVVDIQNAMNALSIAYQATNIDDIKCQLDIISKNDHENI